MLKKLLIGLFVTATLAGQALPVAAVSPSPVQFMAAECPGRLLTLPSWYRGLPGDTSCKPTISKLTDIWIIGLNVVEMMMHATVYVAAGFIMWAGFRYMLANGEPDKISSAKNTITHAVIGLAISVMAIAGINFIVDAAF